MSGVSTSFTGPKPTNSPLSPKKMRVPPEKVSPASVVRGLFSGNFHFFLQEETASEPLRGSLLPAAKRGESWGSACPALTPGPRCHRPAPRPPEPCGPTNETPRNSMTSSAGSLIGRRRAEPAPFLGGPESGAGPTRMAAGDGVPTRSTSPAGFSDNGSLRRKFCSLTKARVFLPTNKSTGLR